MVARSFSMPAKGCWLTWLSRSVLHVSHLFSSTSCFNDCCSCRVELCSNDGSTLKGFSLDECDGGPHEFRGVKRSTLLEALQSIVPESCIEYNAAIHSVETDQNGEGCSAARTASCFVFSAPWPLMFRKICNCNAFCHWTSLRC